MSDLHKAARGVAAGLLSVTTIAVAAQQSGAPGGNPDPMARISREYVRLALAMRTSEFIADARRKGEL